MFIQEMLTFFYFWSNPLSHSSQAPIDRAPLRGEKAGKTQPVWSDVWVNQMNTDQTLIAYATLGYPEWLRGGFGSKGEM